MFWDSVPFGPRFLNIARCAWLQHLALTGLPIPHTQCMDSRAWCELRVHLHPHRWPGCHPFGPCSMFLLTTVFSHGPFRAGVGLYGEA